MSVAVYTKAGGKSASKVTLPKSVFGLKVTNHQLLQTAYLASEGNARQNLSRTKTRTEVSGGGRKPHPQKGTGRARSGSIRNPIWRGGGIIFGPRGEQNYKIGLNKSSKKKALAQALSLTVEQNRVSVIDDIGFDGKTASAAKLMKKLDINRGLVVTDKAEDKTVRSLRNLAGVELTTADKLSAADVLAANQLLLTKPAISALESRLGGKS